MDSGRNALNKNTKIKEFLIISHNEVHENFNRVQFAITHNPRCACKYAPEEVVNGY